MNSNPWLVITSINYPTDAIKAFCSHANRGNMRIVVVGDTKTPDDWEYPSVDFLSLHSQSKLFSEFADALPFKHYSRKNLGYVYALKEGATHVFDTDDDNLPYPEWSLNLKEDLLADLLSGESWANVYSHYSSTCIWPRGLPLNYIHKPGQLRERVNIKAPIKQYLADCDPDVDAIFRLVNQGETRFNKRPYPIAVDRGVYVPFNSQNTVISRQAARLLYLPSFVSFRMTDIWRSFIAQRISWEMGWSLVFDNANLFQVRNEHDLMIDFQSEIPGYLQNQEIGRLLSSLNLTGKDLDSCLITCYESLVEAQIVDGRELPLLKLWLKAIEHAD